MLAEFTKCSTVGLHGSVGLTGELKIFSETLDERALSFLSFDIGKLLGQESSECLPNGTTSSSLEQGAQE